MDIAKKRICLAQKKKLESNHSSKAEGETFSVSHRLENKELSVSWSAGPPDFSNNKIRWVEVATGAVTTIAGSGIKGSADGVGDAAQFCCPAGIAISPDGGVLFVADFENHMIRRVEVATGEVTTLAGSSESSMNSGPTSTRRSSRTWLRGGLPTRRAQSRTSPRRETVRRASATTACATDPRCPQRC